MYRVHYHAHVGGDVLSWHYDVSASDAEDALTQVKQRLIERYPDLETGDISATVCVRVPVNDPEAIDAGEPGWRRVLTNRPLI